MSAHEPITDPHATITITTNRLDTDDTHQDIALWLPIVGPTAIAVRDIALHHLETHLNPTLTATIELADLADRCGITTDRLVPNLWRARQQGFWTHANHDPHKPCVWVLPNPLGLPPANVLERQSARYRARHASLYASTTDRAAQL